MRLEAQPPEGLSPGLWLVKWLLLIPHVIVLMVLWLGYAVLWVVALFAVVITGRFPRGIFEYQVGVLRWTWRVSYYGYSALGTDTYPPFTFAEYWKSESARASFPARFKSIASTRSSQMTATALMRPLRNT